MTDLEALLRGTSLRHGRIQLYVSDGQWSGTISHFDRHMTHPLGNQHDDPVDALRAVLIEDARQGAELRRRYAQAAKFSGTLPAVGSPHDLALDKHAGVDPDFDAVEDLLG